MPLRLIANASVERGLNSQWYTSGVTSWLCEIDRGSMRKRKFLGREGLGCGIGGVTPVPPKDARRKRIIGQPKPSQQPSLSLLPSDIRHSSSYNQKKARR